MSALQMASSSSSLLDPKQLESLVLAYLRRRGFTNSDDATNTSASNGESADALGALAMDAQLAVHAASLAQALAAHTALSQSPDRYEQLYSALKAWLSELLDAYSSELRALLWPYFVHCFVGLQERGFMADAFTFFARHRKDHEPLHHAELVIMAAANNNQDPHRFEQFVKTAKQRKIELSLSSFSLELLLRFFDRTALFLGVAILTEHVHIKVLSRRPWKSEQHSQEVRTIDSPPANDFTEEIRFGALPQIQKVLAQARAEQQLEARAAEAKGKENEEHAAEGAETATEKRAKKRAKRGRRSRAAQASSSSAGEPAGAVSERITVTQQVLASSSYDLPALSPEAELSLIEDLQHRARLSASVLPSVAAFTVLNSGSALTAAELATDGSLALAALADSTIRGFDIAASADTTKAASAASFSLCGHRAPVFSLSLTSNAAFLLSGSADRCVRLWHCGSRSNLVNYRGHSSTVWSVQWSPLGAHFASASADTTARVWSTERATPLRILVGHRDDVECVQWHPNCQYLATGAADHMVRLWDVATGGTVRVLTGHRAPITALAFNPDGRSLASGDASGAWLEFDLSSARQMQQHRQTDRITALQYTREGEAVATGSSEGVVRLWHVKRSGARAGTTSEPAMTLRTKDTPIAALTVTQRNLLLVAGPFTGTQAAGSQ